jgi:uncharacterized membrane protein (Fun14 family)
MPPEPKTRAKYHWHPWKILLFVLAGVLVAAGGVMALGGKDETPARTTAPVPTTPGAVSGVRNLFGSGGALNPAVPTPAAAPESDESLSPAFLRGGLSFFVAFAVAFAFRLFVKLAMFFVGLWLASLFLLSSAGYIEIHWSAIDASFTSWAGAIGKQFESFRTFIQGSLPSAGLAGAGLLAGFRRR